MNVQCLSCSSRYSVPDDKVQGRKVRIKCKKCSEPILIDGTELGRAQVPSARPRTQSSSPGRHEAAKKRTMIGMPSALASGASPGVAAPRPGDVAERRALPSAHQRTLLGGLGAAEPKQVRARIPQKTLLGGLEPAPASTRYVEEPWTVAITEEDQRELTTDEVVALYAAGTIDEGTYVWKDGMDDWCAPFEAPALRRALNAARIAPRQPLDSEDDEDDDENVFDDAHETGFEAHEEPLPNSPLADAGHDAQRRGMWHEPGRVARDADPSFEDVTVSMNERQTEGLLEKARQADLDMPSFRRGAPLRRGYSFDDAEEVPTAVRAQRPEQFGFDDDEVTRAISTTEARAPLHQFEAEARQAPAFELSQRKLTPAPAPSWLAKSAPAQRTPAPARAAPQRPAERAENSVMFSLAALTQKSGSSAPPPKRAMDLMAPAASTHVAPPAARRTLPGLAAAQPPAPPRKLHPIASSAPPAAAPPQPAYRASTAPSSGTPAPLSARVPAASRPPATPIEELELDVELPVRRRARWPWVALLLLVVGAGSAGYLTKQPLQLWAEVHRLTGGQFPNWSEFRRAPEPAESAATAKAPSPADPRAEASRDATAAQVAPAPETTPSASAEPETARDQPSERAAAQRDRKPAPARAPDLAQETGSDEPQGESEGEAEAEEAELPEFDRSAAAEALGTAAQSATTCKSPDGPTGRGRATVTFANSGRATNADVTGAFAGTSVGGCVARLFRQARVPAFSGPPVKVAKSFTIE